MLEECGLDYETHWGDIGQGDQFDPDFLEISPNQKIPAPVKIDGSACLTWSSASTDAERSFYSSCGCHLFWRRGGTTQWPSSRQAPTIPRGFA